ncbi:hypothetical protein Bca52824_033651 [Brassica carinata]|uniref:BZIP domain-containing protein n=1 Tax=Brassica carinata TaxID=52824 RepID=A0A8X7SEC4_BRACI|nr:hypothetical protein Bca52824_033651 [Brassica carinata]
MGTHINFNNSGGDVTGGNGSSNNQSKPLGRQSSLYSLTFDELQSTLGEPGKEFGGFATGGGSLLQRQGSLTLPRTLSQKTVDEVWKNLMSKDSSNGTDAPERQQTLGEITLEDFLLRAGVVKEDSQQNQNSSGEFYANNGVSTGLGFGFGQPNQNNISFNRNNSSMILNQAPATMQQQLQQPHQRLPPTIYPKQANVPFAAHVNNNSGFAAMGKAGVTVASTSPGRSSAENNAWSSPVPYVLGGQGRRSNTGVERVVERRQKRMIKNRESAARSRARKQAYTLELEAEIENLKQLNQDLKRKQAEIVKTQKNELKESPKQRPWLAKTQCLRRTLTGPW